MSDHRISVHCRTEDYESALLQVVHQTMNSLCAELQEHPGMTINASLYVKDIGFLLMLYNRKCKGLWNETPRRLDGS